MRDVLLDTSFILPTLGVEVKEVGREEIEAMKAVSEKARFWCSQISFVEILGLLAKSRNVDKHTVSVGIRSLLESGRYGWVSPTSEALRLALELRIKGHKDNIDNILYSTACESKMLFLSLDSELKSFLRQSGYDASIVIGIRDLSKMV